MTETESARPFMNVGIINAVVVHHSAGPRSQTTEAIRDYHKRERHYNDIAYHYIIEGDGSLHYGRVLPKAGAHALGRNADTIGICIVGDNTDPENAWLPVQIETLQRLLSAIRLLFPSVIVIRHADAYAQHKTECPGLSQAQFRSIILDGR